MAEVDIRINGRQFSIACDDGQEQRVLDLANYVDAQVRNMAAAGAGSNDSHLLVLTSIIMADELFSLRDAQASGVQPQPQAAPQQKPVNGITITREEESSLIHNIDKLSARVEAITGTLHKAA